jgi:hypothetical protein
MGCSLVAEKLLGGVQFPGRQRNTVQISFSTTAAITTLEAPKGLARGAWAAARPAKVIRALLAPHVEAPAVLLNWVGAFWAWLMRGKDQTTIQNMMRVMKIQRRTL